MTNSPGVTYTYDNDGNMVTATTSSGTTTYTYDYENRLTSVDQNGTVTATYTYDALGRRIGIDDSGTQTWTVYNGTDADANPYADFTARARLTSGTSTASGRVERDPGADQLERGHRLVLHRPARLGGPTSSTRSGNSLDTIVYDPFGNIVSETSPSSGDRFKFAGMQYDSTTGLYYDHARYYDAAIGRFVSQDPMGFAAGDANLYRYVANQPTNSTDPSGNWRRQVWRQRTYRGWGDGQQVGLVNGGEGAAPIHLKGSRTFTGTINLGPTVNIGYSTGTEVEQEVNVPSGQILYLWPRLKITETQYLYTPSILGRLVGQQPYFKTEYDVKVQYTQAQPQSPDDPPTPPPEPPAKVQ